MSMPAREDQSVWPGSWSAAWTEACSRLLHIAHPARDERWRRYWDLRSESYLEQLAGDEPLREEVVSFMVREGLLAPGDAVLDVGCGPGPYSLIFARSARSVAALDVSQGMLDRLSSAAVDRGIGNIRPICSSWEKYRGRKKYDLVFSSFCPGVNGPEALIKMERHCRRSCCYVTGGGPGQPEYMYVLWEMLTGERPQLPAGSHFFAFNMLYESGRMPNVRVFRHRSQRVSSKEEIVRNALQYFGMLLDLDESAERTVEEFVLAHVEEKAGNEESDRSMYLVYWQPA
jgi:SAM-dependent methyltransferase